MPSLYRTVTVELRKCGFEYSENAKGSHEKWVDADGKKLIVPRSMKSKHTANGILKDAGSDVKL